MNKKKPQNMNNKGDVVSEFKLTKEDWRRVQYTNVFQYLNESMGFYLDYFSNFEYTDEGIEKAMQVIDGFYCKHLYVMPKTPPFDFYIEYYNWQLGLRVEYFKEVLEERAFIEGHQPSHKYSRLILPKKLHEEIMNCINDNKLLIIRDLLFEVIAIAREKYTSDVAFWENPEMQKLIKTAQKQTENAIELIERLETKAWIRGDAGAKKPSELRHINFVFNDGTVKIDHAWLAREFIEHFKNHYDNLFFKNWKMDLKRYPHRFVENIQDQQFKYQLAKSFYNLLTETGMFKVKPTAKTPNDLMLCIAQLIEFCLIPVGDAHEPNDVKIKHIRNWIKRKEFESDIISAEVPADVERLKKYFEPDFVALAEETKGVDVIHIGGSIAKRFNIEYLSADLVHIAEALKEGRMLVGHQLSSTGFRPSTFPEFKSFRKLIEGVTGKRKIASIKFRLEGDDADSELTQRLPLYLIEEALRNYYEDQAVEMDTELVPTRITKIDDRIRVDKDSVFSQPEQRFMVRFTKSFYNYLLTEAPPNDSEYRPSERYYAIIANMLQQSWFFQHKRHDEWFVINKVRQWHDLSQINS